MKTVRRFGLFAFLCGGLAALSFVAPACGSSSSAESDIGDEGGGNTDSGGTDSTQVNDANAPGNSDGADTGSPCTQGPCVTSISVGGLHSCALISDGTVRCWGSNAHGELGFGAVDGGTVSPAKTAIPTPVSGVVGAVAVTAGGASQVGGTTCVLLTSGVVCFGSNVNGQLGRGDTSLNFDVSAKPAQLPSITQMSLAGTTGCAVASSGGIDCWGGNQHFQLGTSTASGSQPTPMAISAPAGATFAQVSVGYGNVCAVAKDKHVWCWGNPFGGQLGRPTTGSTSDRLPGEVVGIANAVQVAAGYVSACAVLDTGVIACWGAYALGRNGAAGTPDSSAAPIAMPPGVSFMQVVGYSGYSAGYCALDTTGSVWCWGDNKYGSAGSGTTDNTGTVVPDTVLLPTRVAGVANVVQIAAEAAGSHVCARIQGGGVKCWGNDVASQLGTPRADGGPAFSITPLDVHF